MFSGLGRGLFRGSGAETGSRTGPEQAYNGTGSVASADIMTDQRRSKLRGENQSLTRQEAEVKSKCRISF